MDVLVLGDLLIGEDDVLKLSSGPEPEDVEEGALEEQAFSTYEG